MIATMPEYNDAKPVRTAVGDEWTVVTCSAEGGREVYLHAGVETTATLDGRTTVPRPFVAAMAKGWSHPLYLGMADVDNLRDRLAVAQATAVAAVGGPA